MMEYIFLVFYAIQSASVGFIIGLILSAKWHKQEVTSGDEIQIGKDYYVCKGRGE